MAAVMPAKVLGLVINDIGPEIAPAGLQRIIGYVGKGNPVKTWEEAAAPTLVGTTAYRMLHGWAGNTVREGDVVLVWGGSGGLGTQACQLARAAGARPVAVVSDEARGEYAMRFGAIGFVGILVLRSRNRRK